MLENALFTHAFGYIHVFELTSSKAGRWMIAIFNWITTCLLPFYCDPYRKILLYILQCQQPLRYTYIPAAVNLAMLLSVSPSLLLYLHLYLFGVLSDTLGIASILVIVVISSGVTMVVTVDLPGGYLSLLKFPLNHTTLTNPYH